MEYRKEIHQSDTGVVFASVYSQLNERVGLKIIDGWPFESQESKLKRAQLWADKWIANCEKYCTK